MTPAAPVQASVAATVRLSAVVVNFRRRDETVHLVTQLDACDAMRSTQAEIVIVDNDSNPKPLKGWARKRPGVMLRSFGRNRGFARAVNEGCRLSRGEWLLLLNPDVSVPDEFLDRVVSLAERRAELDPRTGVIGLGLRHADGTAQPSWGPFPTLANVVLGLVRPRAERRCRPAHTTAATAPWVTGCCLLVRRECWIELGGFDPDFFLYYEDVDLCRRAQDTGWTVWHEPGLEVTHFHPLHSRAVEPPLRVITRHALLTYAQKHWPEWQWRTLARMIAVEAKLRGAWARCRGQHTSADLFGELRDLAADLRHGRSVRARHRLGRAADALTADEG